MSAFATAFMDAFHAEQKWHDADGESVEYQSAINALEGAKARARFGVDKCPAHRAIAALVAYEEAGVILEDHYTSRNDRDDDERQAIRLIRETLHWVWEDADKAGGTEARPYAVAVGAMPGRSMNK